MKYILFLLFLPILIMSQEPLRNRIGIYGSYGINIHQADFKRLPDCYSCSPGFRSGIGFGPAIGLSYDHPWKEDMFLTARVLHRRISGDLVTLEPITVIVQGNPVAGEFRHELNTVLTTFGFEPGIKYRISDGWYFNAGLNISWIRAKEYDQSEKIVEPSDYGTFLNPDGSNSYSRIRNEFSGTLKEASEMFVAPMISISHDLPLNADSTLLLEPEASYYLGLTNIVNDALVKTWTVNTLSVGVSVKYSPRFQKKKKTIQENLRIIDTITVLSDSLNIISIGLETEFEEMSENDTAMIRMNISKRTDTLNKKKTYLLTGSINAVGVDDQGKEIDRPIFNVEEYSSNRLEPLLHYVFFDHKSSEIPKRYSQLDPNQVSQFTLSDLHRDSTIRLYRNILNIIGKRMQEYPFSSLTLIGCNSDIGEEKGNLALSEQRALSVKDYLVKTWKIAPNRMFIEKRNLPEKKSTPFNESDPIEENRRVEIYSDNPKILEYIFIENIDRKANPPIVRFKVKAQAESGISQWSVKAFQQSAPQQSFESTGTNLDSSIIDWQLEENQQITPRFQEILKSALTLTDNKGNQSIVKGNDVRVEVKTIQEKRREIQGDYEIERYSLILFDFNTFTIADMNNRIIEHIKSRLKPHSIIEILGYTDRTGNAEYNRTLAEERALETSHSLGRKDAVKTGIGKDILLYDNASPEGRFYCRTVQIIVKTKYQNLTK